MTEQILPPSKPCPTCPYRCDVPSGIWAAEEYAKLPAYDEPTFAQPASVFLCHQLGRTETAPRACAGWAGCHDGDELLALRMGVADGRLTVDTALAIRDYVSPVPLFASGAAAAEHGMAEVEGPGPRAETAIAKLTRARRAAR